MPVPEVVKLEDQEPAFLAEDTPILDLPAFENDIKPASVTDQGIIRLGTCSAQSQKCSCDHCTSQLIFAIPTPVGDVYVDRHNLTQPALPQCVRQLDHFGSWHALYSLSNCTCKRSNCPTAHRVARGKKLVNTLLSRLAEFFDPCTSCRVTLLGLRAGVSSARPSRCCIHSTIFARRVARSN